MPENCKPCQVLKDCIQFQDFVPSNPNDKIYYSKAQTLTVTCPAGTTATVPLDAGIIAYVLTFSLGNPPYPNLTLNCTGGTISIPVPDDVTQAQLDGLINRMLNQCLTQIAIGIGCGGGVFFNTMQQVSCLDQSLGVLVPGALPAGVSPVDNPGGTGNHNNTLVIAAGTIQSTISIADANAKALQVLNEIFSTRNAICGGSP